MKERFTPPVCEPVYLDDEDVVTASIPIFDGEEIEGGDDEGMDLPAV